MPDIRCYRVNAFTASAAGGNPAGVVLSADTLSEAQMQALATRLAMSETAFVMTPTPAAADKGATHRVRFFTPEAEVDLCGHATIATFSLIAQLGLVHPTHGTGNETTDLAQETKAGVLPVRIHWCDGQLQRVMMDQARPRILRTVADAAELALVAALLGVSAADLRIGNTLPSAVTTGLADLIVPVRDRDTLWRLRPDDAALSEYSRQTGTWSIHAFTLETEEPGHTAQCRDFSPVLGIPEESATGTASGATGALLLATGLVPLSEPGADGQVRTVCLTLEQGYSMGRPSLIAVEVDAAPGSTGPNGGAVAVPQAVRVGGQAVLIKEELVTLE